jgi:predicted ATPase
MLQATMETLLAERHTILQTTFAKALAEGLAALGRHDEALPVLDEAIASTARNGGSFDLPEILRVKGRLLETGPAQNHSEAEAYFIRALESASAQGALGWELRSAISLARLWSRQGRFAAARDALAERYERFTQGFRTADLREAKQLLAELRP